MRNFLSIFALLILLAVSAQARLGRAGATFLSLGGGTRPVALGGAYTAFAEGIQTIYWNPAGIAMRNKIGASATHSTLYAGMSQECLSFVSPVSGGAVGFSIMSLLSGEMEVTRYNDWETGETFSCNSYAAGFSYGRRMTNKFNAGATIKIIYENIHKISSMGFAIDAGATYNTRIRNLRFGFVIQNFGPDLSYSGEALDFWYVPQDWEDTQREDIPATLRSEPYLLPMTFRGGLAYDIFQIPRRLTVIADIIHPTDQDATFALGAEYGLDERYFLRFGYTQFNDRGLTCGVGGLLDFAGTTISIDYTYEDHRYLESIHRLTLGYGSY